jgi:ABC-2 type transport system permease protein
LLWIIDWTGSAAGNTGTVLDYLSMLRHYEALMKGLINTTDLIYFVLVIVTFLVLSVHSLDNDRLQK